MMNEYITVFILFFGALFLYERYLYISSATALIIRDRMIKLISEHEDDENISQKVIDRAKTSTYRVFFTNLIPTTIKTIFKTRNKAPSCKIDLNKHEKKFLKKILIEAIKLNMISYLFSYAFLFTILFIVGFLLTFVLLIIGQARKLNDFFNELTEEKFVNVGFKPSC